MAPHQPALVYLRVGRVFFSLVPLVAFLTMAVVMVVRGDWPMATFFGVFAGLWALTLAWRARSGIGTWTLTATISALATGARPSRDGIVGKGTTRPEPSAPRSKPLEGQ